MPPPDPYALDPARVREPPDHWLGRLRYLGPGFVLSASIVGSGELIATTTLGARAGFVALWVILLSCLVKVALQLEFGRHTIQHGRTSIEAFNALPGPRVRGVHWSVWAWLALQPLKILQMGGIIGAVALVVNMAAPTLSVSAWCWVHAAVVATLISLERYRWIERTSLVLLALFTALTLTSVIALQWTPFAITLADVGSGLTFTLPAGALLVVLGAFGLTGVGGDEIMQYTYWMLEKGYAAYTGPRDGTAAWRRRARGWMRVMYMDALASMVAYTIVTVAFYLLGAAVLHAQNRVPEEDAELINTLAAMYVDTLGPWARDVFLLGAFVVLFSTLFSALAVWARIFADAFAQFGWYDFRTQRPRAVAIRVLAWAFPITWATLYITYEAPVAMVVLGGVATSAILLLVVYAAIDFRYRQTLPNLTPGVLYDIALWCSALAIVAFAAYGLYDRLLAGVG